jgi:hypothetical protein
MFTNFFVKDDFFNLLYWLKPNNFKGVVPGYQEILEIGTYFEYTRNKCINAT